MENRTERRQAARYPAKDRAFAVLRSRPTQLGRFNELSMGEIAAKLLKNKPNILGQIADISSGGLAFTYFPTNRTNDNNLELDILFMYDRFFLYKVPYAIVDDVQTAAGMPDGMMPIRRCSIKFGRLHHNQKSQLDYFIANFTKSGHPN